VAAHRLGLPPKNNFQPPSSFSPADDRCNPVGVPLLFVPDTSDWLLLSNSGSVAGVLGCSETVFPSVLPEKDGKFPSNDLVSAKCCSNTY